MEKIQNTEYVIKNERERRRQILHTSKNMFPVAADPEVFQSFNLEEELERKHGKIEATKILNNLKQEQFSVFYHVRSQRCWTLFWYRESENIRLPTAPSVEETVAQIMAILKEYGNNIHMKAEEVTLEDFLCHGCCKSLELGKAVEISADDIVVNHGKKYWWITARKPLANKGKEKNRFVIKICGVYDMEEEAMLIAQKLKQQISKKL